jgi:hypothetical protein
MFEDTSFGLDKTCFHTYFIIMVFKNASIKSTYRYLLYGQRKLEFCQVMNKIVFKIQGYSK